MVPNRWTDFDKPLLLFGYQRECELQSCSQRWRSVGIGSRRVSSTRTTPRSAEKGLLESSLVWRFLRQLTCGGHIDVTSSEAAKPISLSCVGRPRPSVEGGRVGRRHRKTSRVRYWPVRSRQFSHLTRVGCIDRGELARLFRRSLPFVSGHLIEKCAAKPPSCRGVANAGSYNAPAKMRELSK